LFAQLFKAMIAAAQRHGHLAQLFVLIRHDVQRVDVVRPRGKDAHDFQKRAVTVLHKDSHLLHWVWLIHPASGKNNGSLEKLTGGMDRHIINDFDGSISDISPIL
jgi:hypothetical protein